MGAGNYSISVMYSLGPFSSLDFSDSHSLHLCLQLPEDKHPHSVTIALPNVSFSLFFSRLGFVNGICSINYVEYVQLLQIQCVGRSY